MVDSKPKPTSRHTWNHRPDDLASIAICVAIHERNFLNTYDYIICQSKTFPRWNIKYMFGPPTCGRTVRIETTASPGTTDITMKPYGKDLCGSLDLAIKTQHLFAHGMFELSYDIATLLRLAQVNRVTWSRCRMTLVTENMDMKDYTDVPERHRRIGRPIHKNDDAMPTDVQCFLFNKRIRKWSHHRLPFHQILKLEVRQLLATRGQASRKKD